MRYILLLLSLVMLSACDSNEPQDTTENDKSELSEQERADNTLLKMQDDTIKKTEDAINDAMEKQQQALDSI